MRPVVTPITTIGVVLEPGCTPAWVVPPSPEMQVAVNCVTGEPWFAAKLWETMSVPLAVVVVPDTVATFFGAAGAPIRTAALGSDSGPMPVVDLVATVNV